MTEFDLDRLVRRAVEAVSHLARRGSIITTGVGLLALLVTGATYLVGLGAFTDGARVAWTVLGAALLLFAVGAPLLASFRLRAIPHHANELVGELRLLLGRNDEARRVVIDTVAIDSEPSTAVTAAPTFIVQSGQYTALHRIAIGAGDVQHLAKVTRELAYLPSLVFIGLALTGLAAFLGFVFTLIWIF
jgi:hypothetical protein